MNRIPALPAKDANTEAWQRKAAFIVNLLRGAVDRAGATDDRPEGAYAGFQYFDTDLGKPVWWSGAAWVKSDGTTA